MPFDLTCPNCGRAYKIADQHAGRKFACKQCGQPVQVPGVAAAAPAAPAEPPPAAPPRAPMNRPAAAGVAPRAPMSHPEAAGPAPEMPYGAQPEERTGPRKANIVFLIGAFAMFVGFFLPWISIDLYVMTLNIGGYELPGKFNSFVDLAVQAQENIANPDAKQMADLEQARSMRSRGTFLYSIYLIPLLTLAVAIEEFLAMRKGRNWWWARAIAAASPIIAYITVWIAFADLAETAAPSASRDASASDIFKIIGAGVYISFLGFVLATVGIFTSPKPKPIRTMPVRRPRPMPPRPAGPATAGAPAAPSAMPKPKLPGGLKLPTPRK